MINDNRIDALAAAFITLGRLHLDAPDEATLAQLRTMYHEWPLADPALADTAAGLQAWNDSFERAESVDQLRADINALYGRTATALVAPFESVHRGKDGLVFDEETLQVRAEYQQIGLQAPHLHKEPDDHIGLEFDFVAQVLVRVLDALEVGALTDANRYLDVVGRFYREHLALWAPHMLVAAREQAQTAFYRGVQALSLGALAELELELGDIHGSAGEPDGSQ
ncbi:molecular chaperone TorD family protein [Trueperella pyogenes]|uniref:TorD/DmsD family molecular chaperone n=1 Tax=Trueperella pyogenes TaxID=1661 RepID=UPI00345DC7C0